MKKSNGRLLVSAVILSLLALHCRGKNQPSPDPQMVKMKNNLTQFFSVTADENDPFSGLWSAEQTSLVAAIEKKYLASYKAQPDEASREVLRERLAGLKTYLRLENGKVQMVTISPDGSFGSNVGAIQNRTKKSAEVLLQGKDRSSTTVKLDLKDDKDPGTRIHYYEDDSKIVFFREKEEPGVLVKKTMETLEKSTSLPEY